MGSNDIIMYRYVKVKIGCAQIQIEIVMKAGVKTVCNRDDVAALLDSMGTIYRYNVHA